MTLRRLLLLFALHACFLAPGLQAQMTDEALPQTGEGENDLLGDTLPLIPEPPDKKGTQPEYEPDLPQSSGVRRSVEPAKPSETRLAIEKQERQVEMRQAKIKAERDSKALEALAQAERARTDAERRYAMGVYYDRLYALMLKINPGLKQDELELRKKEATMSLTQKNIRPSIWSGAPEAAR